MKLFENSKHPDSSLMHSGSLPATGVVFHPEIISFAQAIKQISANPDLRTLPAALVVGSAPFGNEHSNDIDFEVYGVKEPQLRAFLNAQHNEGRISKLRFGGNAFLFATGEFTSGKKFDISFPALVPSKINRYSTTNTPTIVPDLDIGTALGRRDFTFTAVAIDPLEGRLYDPFDGKSDFENDLLRAVHTERIGDDPLNGLRAVRFVARYGFTIEPATFQALQKAYTSDFLKNSESASLNRIQHEFCKLFMESAQPSKGLQTAKLLGIYREFFPMLNQLASAVKANSQASSPWNRLLTQVDDAANEYDTQKASVNKREQVHHWDWQRVKVIVSVMDDVYREWENLRNHPGCKARNVYQLLDEIIPEKFRGES